VPARQPAPHRIFGSLPNEVNRVRRPSSAQVSGGLHTLQPVQSDCSLRERGFQHEVDALSTASWGDGGLGEHLEDVIGLGCGIHERQSQCGSALPHGRNAKDPALECKSP
jgi:hypothetical protein